MYFLEVAKGGLKMAEVPRSGRGQVLYGQSGEMANLTGTRAGVSELIPWLKSMTSTEVLDRTGLTAAWNFKVQWPREQDAASELPSALDNQLGLRLVSGQAEVEVFVIDRAERPALE